IDGWQVAIEREIECKETTLGDLRQSASLHEFTFEALVQLEHNVERGETVEHRQGWIQGTIEVSAESLPGDLFKVSIVVLNHTPGNRDTTREDALMHSMVSTHVILGVQGGEFISLLETPADLREAAAQCQNVGAWPVLVGEPGTRDTMLASPII